MDTEFLEKIRADFPQFKFEASKDFRWNFEAQTIFFKENSPHFKPLVLHELGHALSGHNDFLLDIELMRIEAEAWQKACEISANYEVEILEDFIENHLDTYRDWLHKRSLCPNCLINGFQQSDLSYKCAACKLVWRANDSRFKNLHRKIK